MEGTIPGRNVGRYDSIATGKLLAKFIEVEWRIYISGRNQIKINCSRMEDANLLLLSDTLTELGYRTLIPDQILCKILFIHVRSKYSVTEIIREILMVRPASRRFDKSNGAPLSIIDLQLITNFIPRYSFILDVCHYITPPSSHLRDASSVK